MLSQLSLLAAFLTISVVPTFGYGGYYWRDYRDEIPSDAVLGGKDDNGTNIYIGQGYVKNIGLLVVPIKPGQREGYGTFGGVSKKAQYIKILCGKQDNFYWVPAEANNVHLVVKDKVVVFGGNQDDGTLLMIGRINLNGGHRIGKIPQWFDTPGFYFKDYGNEALILSSFEVLMYK